MPKRYTTRVIFPSGNGTRAAAKSAQYSRSLASVARSAGVMKSRMMPSVVAGVTRQSGFYGRFGKGGELKFFDTLLGATAFATAGVVFSPSLNLIPQGITESTRVGRKCTIKKINMMGFLLLNSGTAVTSETYRVMLVVDKQANGAAATVLDVLQTADEKSFNNLANTSRFQVLKNWYGSMNKTADIGTNINSRIQTFKFNKKCEIPIEFDATSGAITTIKSNNIFLIGLSSVGTTLSLSHNTRVRFSDNGQ